MVVCVRLCVRVCVSLDHGRVGVNAFINLSRDGWVRLWVRGFV